MKKKQGNIPNKYWYFILILSYFQGGELSIAIWMKRNLDRL